MPVIKRPQVGFPSGPIKLNSAHPLRSSLKVLLAPFDGQWTVDGGLREVLLGTEINTKQSTPNKIISSYTSSVIYNQNSDGDSHRATLPAGQKLQPPITMIMLAKRTGLWDQNAMYAGCNAKWPHASPWLTYAFTGSNANNVIKLAWNQTGTLTTTTHVTVPQDEWIVWAGVIDSNSTQRLYENGVLVQSDTQTSTSISYDSTTQLGIGEYTSATRGGIGDIAYFAAFDKALTQREIAEFTTRNFPLLAPRLQYIRGTKATPASGDPVTITPGLATITINAPGPKILGSALAQPSTGLISINAQSPQIIGGAAVIVGAASISINAQGPSILGSATVDASHSVITITPKAPGILGSALVQPGNADISINAIAPTISAGGGNVTINTDTATITISNPAPEIIAAIASSRYSVHRWQSVGGKSVNDPTKDVGGPFVSEDSNAQ